MKKGVSTVIVSVLLIMIGVVLFFIVYNFTTSILKQKTSEMGNRTSEFLEGISSMSETAPSSPSELGTATNGDNWCNGADITRDNNVDSGDYSRIADSWGRSDCGEGNEWCNGADINHDNYVNSGDYLRIADSWVRTDCDETAGVSEVPENDNWCNGSDINRDSIVNQSDLTLIWSAQTRPSGIDLGIVCDGSNNWCAGFDLTRDGKVNVLDLTYAGGYNGRAGCGGPGPEGETENWCNGSDINQDGNLTIWDYQVVIQNLNRVDCMSPDWCSGADINRDGNVSTGDYQIFAQNFALGKTGCYGALPECVITNAYFTRDISINESENINAGIGDYVFLIVKGVNCSGEQLNITLYEEDWGWLFDDYVTNFTTYFINGNANLVWRADYSDELFGDAEFRFHIDNFWGIESQNLVIVSRQEEILHTEDSLYYELCVDSSCNNSDSIFDISESPIYLKVAGNTENYEAGMYTPDGNYTLLKFENNMANISFGITGDYEIEIKQTSGKCRDFDEALFEEEYENYENYSICFNNYLDFEVVNYTEIKNAAAEIGKITSCRIIDEPGYYYLAYDLSGNVYLENESRACIDIRSYGVTLNCKGHKIYTNSDIGIYSEGEDTEIEGCDISVGNKVSTSSGSSLVQTVGIKLSGVDDSIIFNNTLRSQDYGLYAEYSDRLIIKYNVMRSNKESGIYISNSELESTTIGGNEMSGNRQGLNLNANGDDSVYVVDNKICGSTGKDIYSSCFQCQFEGNSYGTKDGSGQFSENYDCSGNLKDVAAKNYAVGPEMGVIGTCTEYSGMNLQLGTYAPYCEGGTSSTTVASWYKKTGSTGGSKCVRDDIDCSIKTSLQGLNYECAYSMGILSNPNSVAQCWPECKITSGVCSYSPDGINVVSQPEKYCGDGGRICSYTCDYNGGDGKGKCLTSSSSSSLNTFCQSCPSDRPICSPNPPDGTTSAQCVAVAPETACPSSISSCSNSYSATITNTGNNQKDYPSFMKSAAYSKPSGSNTATGWNSAGIGTSMSGCIQSGNPSIYCQNNEWIVWVPGMGYKSLGNSGCPSPLAPSSYTLNGNSCSISVS